MFTVKGHHLRTQIYMYLLMHVDHGLIYAITEQGVHIIKYQWVLLKLVSVCILSLQFTEYSDFLNYNLI